MRVQGLLSLTTGGLRVLWIRQTLAGDESLRLVGLALLESRIGPEGSGFQVNDRVSS